MKVYNLYPPFLYIPEESDFCNVWEAFCLKLLKIDLKTNDIERRSPPEQGIDLYYRDFKKAYQCKSSEANSKFNLTKAKKSLHDALTIRDTLPWEKYYICSNTNLTGSQVCKLQCIYKNIESKGKDYWVGLCKSNPELVQNDFRNLVSISEKRIKGDLKVNLNIKDIESKLYEDPIKILFYCDYHNTIYELKISQNILIKDLLQTLSYILSFSDIFSESDGRIRLSHYFLHNDVKYSDDLNSNLKLCDVGINDGSIITYWIKVKFTCNGIERDILQFNNTQIDSNDYKSIIKQIFVKFDNTNRG